MKYFFKLINNEKIEVPQEDFFAWNTYPRSDFIRTKFRSGMVVHIPRENILFGYTMDQEQNTKSKLFRDLGTNASGDSQCDVKKDLNKKLFGK